MTRLQFFILTTVLALLGGSLGVSWYWLLPCATSIAVCCTGVSWQDARLVLAGAALGALLAAAFGVYAVTQTMDIEWTISAQGIGVLFIHWLALAFLGVVDNYLDALDINPALRFASA